MATVKQSLSTHTAAMTAVSESARQELAWLLASVLNCSTVWLYAHSDTILTAAQRDRFDWLVQRRLSGEPLAYLLEYQPFYGLDFVVNPAVLIPRSATESLIEWVLNYSVSQDVTVLDLGTGSGAIAVTLAHERPHWRLVAVDQSPEALTVAKCNAIKHGVSIDFVLSDWFAALSGQSTFDLIIANPPYIASNDPHLLDLQYEPKEALIACQDGLAAIQHILLHARDYLNPGGSVVIEHGCEQAEQVLQLAKQLGWLAVEGHQDLAGKDRFLTAQVEP